MPRFSIIVPVCGQPELLSECLKSIRASTFHSYELLVSDDGSPTEDAIREIAAEHGAELVRSARRQGSAAARNRAASVASGDQLVFVDADVTLRAETLQRLAEVFDDEPGLDAVIGAYDRNPTAPNRTSQFRNLLHAHGHQRERREVATFWTGCGAIRRERFFSLGGFEECFSRPSIEDVELGLRLNRAGGRILRAPEIQVTHHKTWTFYSMVETDLFARAIPWAGLVRDHGLPRDFNFHFRDRCGAALSALLLPLLWVALRHHSLWWGMLLLTLMAIAALQVSLLRFLAASRGTSFAISCFPLLLVYDLTCMVGLVVGLVRDERRRDRWIVPSLCAFCGLILTLQIGGAAYHAEFNSHPDEPSHLLSGLMIYDYVTEWPRENPLNWAMQYYMHYPKVAIGHWPPLFYAMEALWWLVAPPSRGSVIALNALLVLLAAVFLYRLVRAIAPPWMALGAALLLIVSPLAQQSFDSSMAEAACLLWSVLLMDATARAVRRPSGSALSLIALWLICALLTKGTAACLLPVPFLALWMSGKWREVRLREAVLRMAAVVVFGLSWYAFEAFALHHSLAGWGGVTMRMPWSIVRMPGLAGYGVLALACGGVCVALFGKRSLAITACSVLVSAAAVSFFLRAVTEPRHWIIVLPALLALSVEFLMWLHARRRWAIAVGMPALVLFPFAIYRQPRPGILALLSQIPRPSRILVAADEGPWIAETALTEKRPGSVVVRASQTLARMDWNGGRYQLLVQTPEEVERRLDELAIDNVIVRSDGRLDGGLKGGPALPPHQVLLDQAVRSSDSWRSGMTVEGSTLFRRVKPPGSPRLPLRIDLWDKIGMVVEEQPGPDGSK